MAIINWLLSLRYYDGWGCLPFDSIGEKNLNGKNGGDLECSTEKIGLDYDV